MVEREVTMSACRELSQIRLLSATRGVLKVFVDFVRQSAPGDANVWEPDGH